MTRINLIDPKSLHTKHLIAEFRELPRVFTLAKRYNSVSIKDVDISDTYILGTGHVKFFYNKLIFLLKRYHSLYLECVNRQFKVNRISYNELIAGCDRCLLNDYEPSASEIAINQSRIDDRLRTMKRGKQKMNTELPLPDGVYETCPIHGPYVYMKDRQVNIENGIVWLNNKPRDWYNGFTQFSFFQVNRVYKG